jgi:predicted metal-binding protein
VRDWVAAKCEFGCRNFGLCNTCPPRSLSPEKMRAVLGEYSRALLLVGPPPLKEYQEHLLAMEQAAFEAGFQEALAFSSGPCALCETCSLDACRCPSKKRPSLEACGVDVYRLAEDAELNLQPPSEHNQYIQYISLILLEEKGA